MAAKRKAESEIPVPLSPETVYRPQPQAVSSTPANRNVVGDSGTAEQSGQNPSSSSSGRVSGRIPNEPNPVSVDMQLEKPVPPPGLSIGANGPLQSSQETSESSPHPVLLRKVKR